MRDYLLLENSFKQIVDKFGFTWPDKAVIEQPKDSSHGDMATNLGLVLTKQAGIPPQAVARNLGTALEEMHPGLLSTSIAGPGFLNISFMPQFWQESVPGVEAAGNDFGRTGVGQGRKVQVEYVSANPTGPLHIGHGRGAAVGDSLARLLRFAGYNVGTEYYINDAGRQMRLLGLSVYLRARELSGLAVDWPEDFYKGDYIKDIARDLLAKEPDLMSKSREEAEDVCFEYAMNSILDGIKDDLREFRVEHEVWFSERSLVGSGIVEDTLNRLLAADLAYEQDGALWFRTTNYGDDKDRVLRKSDGSLTYFASDISYHADKYKRGFAELIDVWGADHHGYIPRMKAAVSALGRDPDRDFSVILIQLVNLLRSGEQVAMSTRSGEFVTLREVLDEVGVDAARFMFLSRKSDSPLDFDLDLVKQRNLENPVYYVQYAHARISTLLRKAEEQGVKLPGLSDPAILSKLDSQEDLLLLKAVERFPDAVQAAAQARGVHSVSYYLMDLAGKLHSFYANHPVLSGQDQALMLARLAMLRAVAQVLRNGLGLLGVQAPGSM